MKLKTTLALLGTLASIKAGAAVWNADGTGQLQWTTAANWNPAVVPDAAGEIATFGSAITANRQVRINNTTITVGHIQFNDNNNYTIQGQGGAPLLELNNSGSPALIEILAGNTGAHSITVPTTLVDDLSFANNAGTAFSFSGTLAGVNGRVISNIGSGGGVVNLISALGGTASVLQNSASSALVLSGANTYSGATTVSAGTLRAAALNTLSGNSTVTVNGTLDLNNFNQSISGLLGGGSVTLGTASLTLNGAANGNNFTGAISGTGSLVKEGANNVAISGNNTHASTVINAGNLAINGTHSGSVTVNAGGLAGTGTIGGNLTVNGGGTVAPGLTAGTVGALNLADANLGDGVSPITYLVTVADADGTAGNGYDTLNGTGALALAGTVTVALEGSAANFDSASSYSWTIASFAGGVSGTPTFNVDTTAFGPSLNGGTFAVNLAGNNVTLDFSPVPEPSTIALGTIGGVALLVGAIRRRKQ